MGQGEAWNLPPDPIALGGTMLTKEQILGADDSEKMKLNVPEWGGDVFIRVMSGKERDRLEGTFQGKISYNNVRARIATLVLCDEEGKLLFSLDDIEALGKKSCAVLDMIFEKAMKLNRITKEDVEELGKNSEDGQTEGSGSD